MIASGREVRPVEAEGGSAREARSLSEIVRHINQSLEVERVTAIITRSAAELLRGSGAWLGMIEGGSLVVAGSFGDGEYAVGDRFPLASLPVPGYANGAITAPLVIGGRTIGALKVNGAGRREFDARDEVLLRSLADHAATTIENARLYRASARTMRHASILAAAARSLALNVEPRAIYADIARIARASLGVDGVSIYLVNEAADAAEPVHGEGVGIAASHAVASAFAATPAARVARTGVAEFLGTLQAHGAEPMVQRLLAEGVASVALLPLIVEGRPRGVLALRFLTPQRFDDEQRRLLADVSAHAAVAMRNALLLADTERRATRLAAVAKVQQAISAAVALDEVYAEIHKAVASVVDAPCFALFSFDEAATVFVPEYLVRDGEPVAAARAPGVPLGPDSATQAFTSRRPNVTTPSSPGWEHETGVAGTTPVAAILSAPIVQGTDVLGVLQAFSYRSGAYTNEDVDLVMIIARQAATAIANARMAEVERRRQEQRQTLATALEIMEQAVFICTSAGVIQYANGAAIREYGYSFDEFAGKHARELTVRRSPSTAADAGTRRPSAHAGVWVGEQIQRRRDGSEFPAWVTISAIHGPDDQETGVVVTVRNLAEEQRVAEQLRQSEKLVALGQLVAGVAHEVNNPLTGISAFAQLLLEERLAPEHMDAVRLIKREADRAVGVVRDLLTFARKTEPRTVSVDINAIIEQTLRLCAYGLRTAGVTVELALAPDLRRVRGDDRQLQQVFLNLIVNAEHAMSPVGQRTLTIRTRNEHGRVTIAVSDTGVGMSPEVQRRAFEPFFTTKPEGTGTGLGLSISYGIVHMHGGQLAVRSAPGAGTTFSIDLPALDAGSPPALPQTAT